MPMPCSAVLLLLAAPISAAAVPATMRAWYVNSYVPDISHINFSTAYPTPSPKTGEVLVQVKAASINPVDLQVVFHPYWKLTFPHVLGEDGAGIVAALGPGSSGNLKVGDEVWFKGPGTFADFVALPEASISMGLKPANLSFELAASMPVVGVTSAGAFKRAEANLPLEGKTVLVLGGSGGTGSVAVQLAKAKYGAAKILTTAGAENTAWLKKLGADEVIDYHTSNWWNESVIQNGTVDFIYDTVGQRGTAPRATGKLKAGGVFVEIAHRGTEVGLDPNPRGDCVQIFVRHTSETLPMLKELVETGILTPRVQQTFSLEEARQAWNTSAAGHVNGKLVLSMATAACSAHQGCSKLAGDCCPSRDGVMLDCCRQSTAAAHGAFVV